MGKESLTRRDFLRLAMIGPMAGSFIPGRLYKGQAISEVRSRVVLIRHPEAVDEGRRLNPEVIQKMLDEAVAALLGTQEPLAAWKQIIKPQDIVGIKTNVWAYLPTGKEVEQAIKRRVIDCGVPEERIGIEDRGVLRSQIFRQATALINVRPARTHYWAGMGGCLKNLITFVPDPSVFHPDTCADLAKLWENPLIKNKVKLNILLMLTPLFHGVGPHHFSEQYVWPYRGIIVGQDPVAVDATGMRILEAKRKEFFGENRPLQPPAHHIIYAETRHHLGVASPARIELLRLGWTEGILI